MKNLLAALFALVLLGCGSEVKTKDTTVTEAVADTVVETETAVLTITADSVTVTIIE